MPHASKFKASFHAKLQGFIFNAKCQNSHYSFFSNAGAHSFTLAFSAKLHGLYVNANVATLNLLGQTKSRLTRLKKLGYSVRFRVRSIGLKCRGLHIKCKSVLRKWPVSSKPKPSASSSSSSSPHSLASVRLPNPRPATTPPNLFHDPERLAQNLEEIFHSPSKLLHLAVAVCQMLHRKLPFTWLQDVGKLYLPQGDMTGLPIASYLASKQRAAILVQALCLISTMLALKQLAIAATLPKLAVSISFSVISLGMLLSLLPCRA